jgi:carboxylesterase type B
MVMLEIKFSLLSLCALLTFAKFKPSLYLNFYTVQTENGIVLGQEKGEYFAFESIPFARNNTKHWYDFEIFAWTSSDCSNNYSFHYMLHESENCSNLNVFVPKKVIGTKKLMPVLFTMNACKFSLAVF